MPCEANARVVSDFLDYLKIEKGLAPLTVRAYSTDIAQFAEYLAKRKRTLITARREDVGDFLQQLLSYQVDGRSVARKLSALRQLYRFLLIDKLIARDPTLNINSPKQWKVLPKSLARDEVSAMLESRQPARDTKAAVAIAARDQAMLELFYADEFRDTKI